eukprot:GHVS01085336.1.p1 GENE.GHVS01085336.1~~GHVS01085336.1.p1  ORF type:complete len:238 (+),score=17.19 GHVS01085336.1:492-1205(+)
MSVTPVTYGSPTVRGVQPPPGFVVTEPADAMNGYSANGMHQGSEAPLHLKGKGLGLLIVAITTTTVAAVMLVGDFMSIYTARKVIDPVFVVGLLVVDYLFFYERRKAVATPRIVYYCYAYVGIAVAMLLVQIYSVIAVVVDICNERIELDERCGVFIMFIVVTAVCASLLTGFAVGLCNTIKSSEQDKPGRHRRTVVHVVQQRAALYSAPPKPYPAYSDVPGISESYDVQKGKPCKI